MERKGKEGRVWNKGEKNLYLINFSFEIKLTLMNNKMLQYDRITYLFQSSLFPQMGPKCTRKRENKIKRIIKIVE